MDKHITSAKLLQLLVDLMKNGFFMFFSCLDMFFHHSSHHSSTQHPTLLGRVPTLPLLLHLQAHATHLSHRRAYTIMFGAQNQGPTWRKTWHLAESRTTWKKRPRSWQIWKLESPVPYQLALLSRWFSGSQGRICYISEGVILLMVLKSGKDSGSWSHFL